MAVLQNEKSWHPYADEACNAATPENIGGEETRRPIEKLDEPVKLFVRIDVLISLYAKLTYCIIAFLQIKPKFDPSGRVAVNGRSEDMETSKEYLGETVT